MGLPKPSYRGEHYRTGEQLRAADSRVDDWLGRRSRAREIRESGLWKVNHAKETSDPAFLDRVDAAVDEATLG